MRVRVRFLRLQHLVSGGNTENRLTLWPQLPHVREARLQVYALWFTLPSQNSCASRWVLGFEVETRQEGL